MQESKEKSLLSTTTLSKIMESTPIEDSPIGLTIQDMAALIVASKKTNLHISLNPFSGNSLY